MGENNRSSLKTLIQTDETYTIGALIRLYSYQTADEQSGHTTEHLNDVGFNAYDADIMTSMAEQYKERGFLTPRQLAYLQKSLKC